MVKKMLALWCLLTTLSFAQQCTGHFVNPFKDICWNCLFPITLGSSEIVHGQYKDTKNPSNIFCSCANSPLPIGFALGFWEPYALVDITRKPYCMVNLGLNLSIKKQGLGGAQMPSDDGNGAFYYAHWYKYPLIYLLQLITNQACSQTDDFDVAYLTELDPTWNDSTLAFIFSPEAVLFTNPLVRGSCAADATQTFGGQQTAIDSLFWCQGSQGSTYPLSGFVAYQTSPISAALLLSERLNFKLHRDPPIVWESTGIDGQGLCYETPRPVMPKSRYRYQLVNTIANAKRCYPFGASVTTWEMGHIRPSDGDNFGYMVWKKRNCCFL